jgi:hypothetical protein
LKASVLYHPITCVALNEETENGATQRLRAAQKDALRKTWALKIQHNHSSRSYANWELYHRDRS